VSIWQQVLDVPDIGVHDSFFDLGGHSLMALQLVARVREQLAIELNVQDVFGKGRTITGMAEVIETRRWLLAGSGEMAGENGPNQDQGLK
jgi:acyl carrier protein